VHLAAGVGTTGTAREAVMNSMVFANSFKEQKAQNSRAASSSSARRLSRAAVWRWIEPAVRHRRGAGAECAAEVKHLGRNQSPTTPA